MRPLTKRQRLLGQKALQDEERPTQELAAPAEYRAAILGLGSAQSRLLPSTALPRPSEGRALIPPEEYVGDDWLDDDLGLNQGSRKRIRLGQEEQPGSELEESTEPESDEGIPCRLPEAARKRRRRIKQSCLTQFVDRIPLGRTSEASVTGSPERAVEASSPVGAGSSTWLSEGARGGESAPVELMRVSFQWGGGRAWLTSGKMCPSHPGPQQF